MPEEPVAERDSSPDNFWKPAMKIGLAFIVMLVAIFIFRIIMDFVFYTLRDMSLIQPDMFRNYPLYTALSDVATGVLLLALAGLFARGQGSAVAWFKKLLPGVNRQNLKVFLAGAVIGAVAAVVTALLQTLTNTWFYGGESSFRLEPYLLLTSFLYLLPQLVMYFGWIVLVQGYFQRETQKCYGALEGLIVAVLAYLLLMIFPSRLSEMGFPLFNAQYLLMGTALGYLYIVSKSLYLPISFIVAYNFFGTAYYSVLGIYPGPDTSFMGVSFFDAYSIVNIVAGILILFVIWLIFRSRYIRQLDRQGLKVMLENVLSRLSRD
jgi:hypothetical protein